MTSFSGRQEEVATESLSHILSSYSDSSGRFVAFCRQFLPGLPDLTYFDGQVASDEDGAYTDVECRDALGKTLVVIEAKFEAGLTKNQPGTYLDRLRRDGGGLLLFVVPSRRRHRVFSDLTGKLDLVPRGGTSDSENLVWRDDVNVLAVVSWQSLIGALKGSFAGSMPDPLSLADLEQLEGLCDYMENNPEFISLSTEELTGQLGARVQGIIGTAKDIARSSFDLGVTEKFSDKTAISPNSGENFVGWTVSLKGWKVLVHCNWTRWAYEAPTPLWIQFAVNAKEETEEFKAFAADIEADPEHWTSFRPIGENWRCIIGLPIQSGMEKAEVVSAGIDFLRDLKTKIPPAPGWQSKSTNSST